MLLVGVGGSGGKTLRALKEQLDLRLLQEGWEGSWPKAWQILHIDSPTTQDGAEFPSPFLPREDYFPLVENAVSYDVVYQSVIRPGRIPVNVLNDVEKPLPSPLTCKVPVSLGAGMYRAVGRTIVLSRLDDVQKKIIQSLGRLNSTDARGELVEISKLFGASDGELNSEPVVVLVSSIAGGSGAGMFMEVAEAIKAAAPSENWIHNILAVLYAPDVFNNVDGENNIEPNALAALCETMSGQWMNNPTSATRQLYDSLGLPQPKSSQQTKIEYNLGPAFPFIVGRRNSEGLDFKTQAAVYKAVAASLSTLLTDRNVQDKMLAYAIGNRDAATTNEAKLPDRSLLKDANRQAPPFSSLGFSRVSLGTDRFFQYASERMTRTAIDKMLFAHTYEDPEFKIRTEDEWIKLKADNNFRIFIEELKLDEETEDHNDVIDALRPNALRPEWLSRFQAKVWNEAQQGLNPKTQAQDKPTWVEKIFNFYQINLETFLDEERGNRNKNAREWVKNTSENSMRVVSRYVSQQGVKVTIELLDRLQDKLIAVADELITEANQRKSWSADIQGYINQELAGADDKQELDPNNPFVLAATKRAADSLGWRADADERELASALLRDMAKNFFAPLRLSLSGGLRALTTSTTARFALDGTPNPYLAFAKGDSDEVPVRFDPAPNEILLIPTTQFPSEYKEQVRRSVDELHKDNALPKVLDEVLLGKLELPDLDPKKSWQLVSMTQTWIPAPSQARLDSSQSDQSASFEFSSLTEEYLYRTRLWMRRKGSPFQNYLDEDLASYLSDSIKDRGELSARRDAFVAAFRNAVALSSPLVKLNTTLLKEIHDGNPSDRALIYSPIPFPVGSSMHKALKEIEMDMAIDSAFTDSNTKVRNVDIFATLKYPTEPIVMDSLMEPIAARWSSVSNDPQTREAFIKWRRARSLFEFVPASVQKKNSIIRGWYVARLMGQIKSNRDDLLAGPKIEVWDGKTGYISFPHPLMFAKILPAYDYPGAVLKSLAIAMVHCNQSKSLAPLAPYHRLMALGGETSSILDPESDLATWVLKGTIKNSSAPIPKPDRGGTPSGSVQERKDAVIKFFQSQIDRLDEKIPETPDPMQDLRTIPYTWEIRSNVHENLKSLISLVAGLDVDSADDEE